MLSSLPTEILCLLGLCHGEDYPSYWASTGSWDAASHPAGPGWRTMDLCRVIQKTSALWPLTPELHNLRMQSSCPQKQQHWEILLQF